MFENNRAVACESIVGNFKKPVNVFLVNVETFILNVKIVFYLRVINK